MSFAPDDLSKKSDPPFTGVTLDQKLASLLSEIELEKTPDRLLQLANELQALLLERKKL